MLCKSIMITYAAALLSGLVFLQHATGVAGAITSGVDAADLAARHKELKKGVEVMKEYSLSAEGRALEKYTTPVQRMMDRDSAVQSMMKEAGLTLRDVPMDGHCQFHCLSQAMGWTTSADTTKKTAGAVMSLRKMIVDNSVKVAAEEGLGNDFVNEADRRAKAGLLDGSDDESDDDLPDCGLDGYGDAATLYVLAMSLNKHFRLIEVQHSLDIHDFNAPAGGDDVAPAATLYLYGNHFQLVVPKEEARVKKASPDNLGTKLRRHNAALRREREVAALSQLCENDGDVGEGRLRRTSKADRIGGGSLPLEAADEEDEVAPQRGRDLLRNASKGRRNGPCCTRRGVGAKWRAFWQGVRELPQNVRETVSAVSQTLDNMSQTLAKMQLDRHYDLHNPHMRR
jgi:hypothetical protein